MKISDIRIMAVLFGVLADIVGSIIVGFGLAIVISIIAVIGHDLSPTHLSEMRQNVLLKLVGLLGTTISTGIGGYIAARLGRPFEYINSLTVGVLCVVLGIGFALLNPGVTPFWKLISGIILTTPAALIGGRFAQSRRIQAAVARTPN